MTTAIDPHATAQGVDLSLSASLLFATMYYYTSWLEPLDGEQIFAWRMLLTVPILALFIMIRGEWQQVGILTARLKHEPLLWITAVLIGTDRCTAMAVPLGATDRQGARGLSRVLHDAPGDPADGPPGLW